MSNSSQILSIPAYSSPKASYFHTIQSQLWILQDVDPETSCSCHLPTASPTAATLPSLLLEEPKHSCLGGVALAVLARPGKLVTCSWLFYTHALQVAAQMFLPGAATVAVPPGPSTLMIPPSANTLHSLLGGLLCPPEPERPVGWGW